MCGSAGTISVHGAASLASAFWGLPTSAPDAISGSLRIGTEWRFPAGRSYNAVFAPPSAMLSSLNFFAPYQHIAAHHENQLTRALLVVLNYSPFAHATWLAMVDPALRIERLPPAQFRTQQSRMLSRAASFPDEESIRGISVFLTPDVHHQPALVSASDRNQILDGIVQYGDELVIAIENKIAIGVDTDQPSAINTHDCRIELDSQVRKVHWQHLLESFIDLVARQLVSGAELKLLEDFLEFAEHHFPQVGPYSTLRRAEKSSYRVKLRLETVLAEAVGVPEPAGRYRDGRFLPERIDGRLRAVRMVFLQLDDATGDVVLRVYPGDTLTQARLLYQNAAASRSLLSMAGWYVRPNFHWGFRDSGACWAQGTTLDVAHYVDYWINNIAATRAVTRAEWTETWSRLQQDGVVAVTDKADFDRAFTNTGKNSATPRPGLCCEYRWAFSNAMQMDDDDKLVGEVRTRIGELLAALGEPLPLN
jgi:hypothetical protein